MKPALTRALGCCIIALVACASYASMMSPSSAQARPLRWILNGRAMTAFTTDPTAQAFFANTQPFVVIAKKYSDVTVPPSWGAQQTRIFTSYNEFARALQNGKIGPEIKAVLYDNEAWTLTPDEEQQNFADYAQRFYELAHQHGYFVISTPAVDLATRYQPAGEKRFDTFVRMNFPANAAKFADAIDIQAQGSQTPPSNYARQVTAAAQQARQANPKVLVFAGISTNPSGHSVTAGQIVAAIDATRGVVDGYWFNVPQQGPSCPHCNNYNPDLAIQVLRAISQGR